jgi:hypothetical protein
MFDLKTAYRLPLRLGPAKHHHGDDRQHGEADAGRQPGPRFDRANESLVESLHIHRIIR